MIYYNEVSPTILKLINKRQKQIDVTTYLASVIPYQIKSKLHLKDVVAKISRIYQKFLSKGLENYKLSSFHVAKFCSYCFQTDEETYVREVWRHPAAICCTVHNKLLSLVCSNCQNTFQYWRSRSINICYSCNFDLSYSNSIFLKEEIMLKLIKVQGNIVDFLRDFSKDEKRRENFALMHLYHEYLFFIRDKNKLPSLSYSSIINMNDNIFVKNTIEIGHNLPNDLWMTNKFNRIHFEDCISDKFRSYLNQLFNICKQYLVWNYSNYNHNLMLNNYQKRFSRGMKMYDNILDCYFYAYGWYGEMAVEYAKYRIRYFEKEHGRLPLRRDLSSLSVIMSRKNWNKRYNITFYELIYEVFGVSNLLVDHEQWDKILQFEWDHNKNNKSPESYTYGSKKMVYWICQPLGHTWKANITSRTKGAGCAKCSGTVLSDLNRLTLTDQWKKYLKDEWYKDNTVNPQELTSGSHEKVNWICSECRHIWPSIIKHRVRGHGCPKCAGNIVSKNNGLIFHPRWRQILKDEWVYDENDKLPKSYSYGSKYHAKWKCRDCSHEWTAEISKRTNPERNCPKCARRRIAEYNRNRVHVNDNNRLTNHWSWNYLKDEWDYDQNNQPPENYARGSNKKTHWKCKKCGYRWEIRTNRRTDGSRCKKCKYDWKKIFPKTS